MTRRTTIDRCTFTRFLAVIVSAYALAACVSTPPDEPFVEEPLFGMVYDSNGSPCSSVGVHLDGEAVATSDTAGRFVVPALARGKHVVTLARDGYESVTQALDFYDRNQVLYVRLTSLEQLLARAEEAIAEEQWDQARRSLARAAAINDRNPVAAYLGAVLDLKTNDPEAALDKLLALQAEGVRARGIYLLMADLYQFHLGRPLLACDALERAQAICSDADTARRLLSLRSSQGEGSD